MARTATADAPAKSRSVSQSTTPSQSPSPGPAPPFRDGKKRYEVPADFIENDATLRLQPPSTTGNEELWLFQLPHELDPAESIDWQVSKGADGMFNGTCQDSEGQAYTMREDLPGTASQLYVTPAAGCSKLTNFKRRVTVVRSDQLPDTVAAAEAVEAVMPSADMPGIPSPEAPQAQELAAGVQTPTDASVQQQEHQQRQQAEQDLLASPDDSKNEHKKAKSEAKKLKKRAMEHTAINEKQSKLQKQSDTPVLAPEAVHVTAAPEIKSEAAQRQHKLDQALDSEAEELKQQHKKEKKANKDKKARKHKQKDADAALTG